MRVQLILLILLLSSLPALAVDDKSMQELFMKYDQVMIHKKVTLIDEVFSKKFLTESGGKAEFVAKVKELPNADKKSMTLPAQITWKKGVKDNIYLARIKEPVVSANKTKPLEHHRPEFIVVTEEGKLKIEGTISDGD